MNNIQKKSNEIKISSVFFIIYLITGCLTEPKKDSLPVNEVLKNFSGEPVVPREANNIIIPEFMNLSREASIALKLSLKLREKINLDGRLAAVSDEDKADLLLQGIIIDYQVQPLDYSEFGRPVNKRLRIAASVKLFDIKKGREIFFERDIQAFQKFSDVIPPIVTEMQIQDKVLDNLADRIVLKTMEGWYTKLMTPVEKGK